MAILEILHYPDLRLRTVAEPVTVFDEQLKQLIADMAETMYHAPGIGLAATQVNQHKQVIVIDLSDTRDALQVFINPRIIEASEAMQHYEEGCLSVPGGIYESVERPAQIIVRADDIDGKPFEMTADGLLAVCLQHEIDHIKGKLFIDYLSLLKRDRIKAKLQKQERELKPA